MSLPQDPRWEKALQQLLTTSQTRRWLALGWLSRQQGQAATSVLLLALRHPDARVQAWAAAGLRKRPGKRVLKALRRALQSPLSNVRLNAVVALGERGYFSWIRPQLKDSVAMVREVACRQAVAYVFDGYPRKMPPRLPPVQPLARPAPRRRARRRRGRRRRSRRPVRRTKPRPRPRPRAPTGPIAVYRMTDGKRVVRPEERALQALLRGCLRDSTTLVRIGTAESLQRYQPHVPKALGRDALLVLRMRRRRPRRWRSRRRYSAQWRLRRFRRYIKSYLSTLEYRIKRTNGWFDGKLRRCYRQYYRALLGQREQYIRWQREYTRYARGGRGGAAQSALSRALLTYRAARTIYNRSSQCRRKYPSYRARRQYRKLLRRSMIWPGTPAFFNQRDRYFAMAETVFAVDSAIDALRHDIHPYRLPEGATVSGPFGDILLGGRARLHAMFRLTRMVQLSGELLAGGMYVAGFEQLSGAELGLKLRLLAGVRKRRRRMIVYIEEKIHWTPGLFPDEGHPDEFVGERLVQEFRLGGTFRWGRLYRRWTRMDEWIFRVSYRNRVVLPVIDQPDPLVWAARMAHFGSIELQKQLFFFWIGLKGDLRVDHFLRESARVPTLQGAVWATFLLGNPYSPLDFLRLEGAVGYGFLLPLGMEQVVPQPLPHEAGDTSAPLAYTGVTGHFSRLPIQWWVRYWHQFGGPTRPPFAHFIEDRFHAEIRFGTPKELQMYFPRKTRLAFGVLASVATYGQKPESNDKNDDKDKALQPKIIRDVSVYAQLNFPLFWGLSLVVGDRISFLRNDFVPYRGDGGEPNTSIARNVFYIKLQYWIGP